MELIQLIKEKYPVENVHFTPNGINAFVALEDKKKYHIIVREVELPEPQVQIMQNDDDNTVWCSDCKLYVREVDQFGHKWRDDSAAYCANCGKVLA